MNTRLFLVFHGRYPSEKAAGIFAFESARAFAAKGYEVIVLAPRRRSTSRGGAHATYLPTIDLFGIVPHALAFRISFLAFSISSYLYLLFRASQRDIVYSNESLPTYLATFSFPHTYFELHDFPHQGRWFYKSLVRRVAGVLITNKLKASRAEHELLLDPSKIIVEPNAVDLAKFSIPTSHLEARKALNLPIDKKIIVYTGHLYGWKGVDTLARSFSFLPQNSCIYFVGGTKEDVLRMQQTYSNTSKIIFTGNRPHEEIPLWQKAADVLVLPNTAKEQISAEDTSPMKLFEYMASGTPVVASRLPSIEEIADDTRAILVTPDDPQALAKGIERALASEGKERVVAARTWVSEHTWGKRAERIVSWMARLPERLTSYQHERIIFRTAFGAATLFIALFVYIHGPAPHFDTLQSDSYLGLAVSLYERGVFTLSTTTPYALQVTHVPGYPFFLALTAAPWNNVLPTLFLQAILFACTAVFVYRLFEGTFAPRVRFLAALVFSLEPYTAFTVAAPLSESLFLFLFVGGLLLVRRAYERQRIELFFITGVVFGMCILVRPVIQYAIPLIALALLAYELYMRHPRALVSFGALVFGVVLILIPWGYRNYDAFGVWTLSTKGPYSLYFFEAAELLKYRGFSPTDATAHLVERAKRVYSEVQNADDLRAPRYASFLSSETVEVIKESPLLFTKMYLVSLGTFFLTDGYRLMGYELTKGALVPPNITRSVVEGNWRALADYLTSHPWQLSFLLLGLVFWSGVFLFAVVGFWASFVRFDQKLVFASIACALAIAYFALLTGPLAQARYRIPVTPFLFLLAVYGAGVVWHMWKLCIQKKA